MNTQTVHESEYMSVKSEVTTLRHPIILVQSQSFIFTVSYRVAGTTLSANRSAVRATGSVRATAATYAVQSRYSNA